MRVNEARKAIDDLLGAIQIYGNMYASAGPFKDHLDELLKCIRAHARKLAKLTTDNVPGYGQAKLLLHFADAIEMSHKSGPYVAHQSIQNPTVLD